MSISNSILHFWNWFIWLFTSMFLFIQHHSSLDSYSSKYLQAVGLPRLSTSYRLIRWCAATQSTDPGLGKEQLSIETSLSPFLVPRLVTLLCRCIFLPATRAGCVPAATPALHTSDNISGSSPCLLDAWCFSPAWLRLLWILWNP